MSCGVTGLRLGLPSLECVYLMRGWLNLSLYRGTLRSLGCYHGGSGAVAGGPRGQRFGLSSRCVAHAHLLLDRVVSLAELTSLWVVQGLSQLVGTLTLLVDGLRAEPMSAHTFISRPPTAALTHLLLSLKPLNPTPRLAQVGHLSKGALLIYDLHAARLDLCLKAGNGRVDVCDGLVWAVRGGRSVSRCRTTRI